MISMRQMKLLARPQPNILQKQFQSLLLQRLEISTSRTTCLSHILLQTPLRNVTKHCSCNNYSPRGHTAKSLLVTPARTMAGHAHWRNVMATKSSVDEKNAALVSGFAMKVRITMAAGGSDVTTNKDLAYTLECMKKSGISKADIQRIVAKSERQGANFKTYNQVVQGPRGAVFVVEVYTDNIKAVRDELKSQMKKLPAQAGNDRVLFNAWFDQKGVVTVPVTPDMFVSNLDAYVEVAIEAGAEDVIITPSDDQADTYVLKFHCSPLIVSQVAREIEETHNLVVSDSMVDFIPFVWAIIDSKEDLAACNKISKKLSAIADVVKVFDNISVPED